MFSLILKPVSVPLNVAKSLSFSAQRSFKVAVAGAAGGIGQPLSLLMKLNPLVTDLRCFDIVPVTPGVAVDLSHLNTPPKVKGFKGKENMGRAFNSADVVVIPAGMPRKPGMSRDDLFNTNASIVRDVMTCVAACSPCAIVCIITNPVNSMVPLAAEVMKKIGVYDPNRIMGVTTLDVVRASTFVGEINGVNPNTVTVPVIGGHAGATIIPLLSQSNPAVKLCDEAKIKALIQRIQEAGTEVVKAKAGGGSATLSMAYAAARFVNSVLKGLCGEAGIVECTYVKSDLTKASHFSSPVLLGRCGVLKNLGYGTLNDREKEMLNKALPILEKNIKAGEQYATKEAQLPGA